MRLSYSLVVVLPLVSIFGFRVCKFRLFRLCACLSNCLRMRARVCLPALPDLGYAGMKSITLAVVFVLRNSAGAVQMSNMMRILP